MLQISYGNVNSKIHFSILWLGVCHHLRFLQAGWAQDALLRGRSLCSTPDGAICKAVSSLLSLPDFIPLCWKLWGIFSHLKSEEHGTKKIPLLAMVSICLTTNQLHLWQNFKVHWPLPKLSLLIQPNKVGLLSQQYFLGPMPKQNALTEPFNTAKKCWRRYRQYCLSVTL